MPQKLTDTAIRTAKPKEKPWKLTDGGGLYVLVSPTGGKLWRLKYRYGGKEKLLALGAPHAVAVRRVVEGDDIPVALFRADSTWE